MELGRSKALQKWKFVVVASFCALYVSRLWITPLFNACHNNLFAIKTRLLNRMSFCCCSCFCCWASHVKQFQPKFGEKKSKNSKGLLEWHTEGERREVGRQRREGVSESTKMLWATPFQKSFIRYPQSSWDNKGWGPCNIYCCGRGGGMQQLQMPHKKMHMPWDSMNNMKIVLCFGF